MVRIYDQLTQPNKKQLQEADTVDFVDTNRWTERSRSFAQVGTRGVFQFR